MLDIIFFKEKIKIIFLVLLISCYGLSLKAQNKTDIKPVSKSDYTTSKLMTTECEQDRIINQEIDTNSLIFVSNQIIASSTIGANILVTFQAGNRIELKPGFNVKPGIGRFVAKIGQCPNAVRTEQDKVVRNTPSAADIVISDREKMIISPNPSKGKVSVKYNFIKGQTYYAKVYDLSSRLVIDKKIKGEDTRSMDFDFTHLDNGLFTFQLTLPNGENKVNKVLIKK